MIMMHECQWTSLIYPLVHITQQAEPTRPIPCILPTGGGPECFLIWSNTRNNSTHISILLVILPNLDHQFRTALLAHMKSGPYELDSTTQNLFPIYYILFISIHLPQIITKWYILLYAMTHHNISLLISRYVFILAYKISITVYYTNMLFKHRKQTNYLKRFPKIPYLEFQALTSTLLKVDTLVTCIPKG